MLACASICNKSIDFDQEYAWVKQETVFPFIDFVDRSVFKFRGGHFCC